MGDKPVELLKVRETELWGDVGIDLNVGYLVLHWDMQRMNKVASNNDRGLWRVNRVNPTGRNQPMSIKS